MPVICDYLAVQWDGIAWVRHEMCQFAKRDDGIDVDDGDDARYLMLLSRMMMMMMLLSNVER